MRIGRVNTSIRRTQAAAQHFLIQIHDLIRDRTQATRFEVLSWHLRGGAEEKQENLSLDGWCPGRESRLASSEHNTEALQLQQKFLFQEEYVSHFVCDVSRGSPKLYSSQTYAILYI